MASSKKGSRSSTAGSNIVSSVEIQRTTADLRNQILESLTGLGELGRGLSGFNGSLRQAGDLIVQVSSSGQMLVQNISKLAEAIRQAKEIKMTSSGAAATSTAGDVAGSASGVSGALGGGSGGGGSIFGAVLGGLGAGASLISGIVGIFRQRREEEKKYQREMQQALNDQLSAEVELSLATSRRLADEQAITREKYKQIESGLQQASGNRQEVVSEIDDRMQELYAEMNGRYSARYKRGASNYYNALLELKNHQDDLDWLETVGSSPLMPSSAKKAILSTFRTATQGTSFSKRGLPKSPPRAASTRSRSAASQTNSTARSMSRHRKNLRQSSTARKSPSPSRRAKTAECSALSRRRTSLPPSKRRAMRSTRRRSP